MTQCATMPADVHAHGHSHAASHHLPAAASRTPETRALPPRAMTMFSAVTIATFLGASAAPTPLYRIYQEGLGLPPVLMTMIFAVYALCFLTSLLVVGSLSDFVGRRPVIFVALLMNIGAMAMFIEAHSATTLIVARMVQGFATGAAATALSAAILDTSRKHGPLFNAVAPFAGLGFGTLVSSLLVTFAPDPTQLIFVVLLVVSAFEAIALLLMPETSKVRSGAWASLIPHLTVPAKARAALLRVTPVNIAAWALGGFYFSLMPSLVRAATGLSSPIVGGLVVAALPFSATITIALVRNQPAMRVLGSGTAIFAAGVALTLAGVNAQLVPLLMLGTVVAGTGFGAAFSGAVASVMPLAAAGERAGLLSAFYVECYLAFSLPAILVGTLTPVFGLPTSAYFYGSAIILLAGVSLVALRGSKLKNA